MLSDTVTASFYYNDTLIGTPAISAAISGISPITQTESIVLGSACEIEVYL